MGNGQLIKETEMVISMNTWLTNQESNINSNERPLLSDQIWKWLVSWDLDAISRCWPSKKWVKSILGGRQCKGLEMGRKLVQSKN